VITGCDGRVCDTPQRTTIAAANREVHDEPVFSRDEEANLVIFTFPSVGNEADLIWRRESFEEPHLLRWG
jgi:hypothetical protein